MGSQTSNDQVDLLLQKAGLSPQTITATLSIDAVLQNWRRRVAKRELGQRALADLRIGLDLAQLDVLVAIDAPANEFGAAPGGETMVATVAERLAIDPSRASRIVGDMVDKGYARRAVSQADARRSIIELTDAGRAVLDAVRAYKFLILGDFLSGWTAEELETFLPLLQRFGRWSEHTDSVAEKFGSQIEALAAGLPRA